MVGIPIKCGRCGNYWTTDSINMRVKCPGCGASVKVDYAPVAVLARKVPLATHCDRCGTACAEIDVCRAEVLENPVLLCAKCSAELTKGGQK